MYAWNARKSSKDIKIHDLLMILVDLNVQYYYDFIRGATNCVNLRTLRGEKRSEDDF